MAIFTKDGQTLMPELTDDATLKSNLMPTVRGRDNIGDVFNALDEIYTSVADIERTSTGVREFIESRAVFANDRRVTIQIIGIRDDNGWIESVTMQLSPVIEIAGLQKLLSAKLGYDGNI